MNDLAIIVIAVFISLILIYSALQNRRKRTLLINKHKTYLKSIYKNRAVSLCYGADDLGKNLIQFYGDPLGAKVRSGMKICDLNCVEYTIEEVYAEMKHQIYLILKFWTE